MTLKSLLHHIKCLGNTQGRGELQWNIRFGLRKHFMVPIVRLSGGYNPFKPLLMSLESTNRCNLKCKMCPTVLWDDDLNPKGDMAIDMFEKTKSYLKTAKTVNLQMLGEPLLAKNFWEMAERVKSYGLYMAFNSNGTLFTEKNCHRLIDLGIDNIGISIDGLKMYKKIRGIDIKKIEENIHRLNRIKGERGATKPELGLTFVAMKSNIHELPELVRWVHDLNIKRVMVLHITMHIEELLDENLMLYSELARPYFEEVQRLADELGILIELPTLTPKKRFCKYPFESLWINWGGGVRPCCMATFNEEGTLKVGNLNESTIEEVWNGKPMRALRMALLGVGKLPDFCLHCPMYADEYRSYVRLLPQDNKKRPQPESVGV